MARCWPPSDPPPARPSPSPAVSCPCRGAPGCPRPAGPDGLCWHHGAATETLPPAPTDQLAELYRGLAARPRPLAAWTRVLDAMRAGTARPSTRPDS